MRDATKNVLFWLGAILILAVNGYIAWQGFQGRYMQAVGTFVYFAIHVASAIFMIIGRKTR